MATKSDFTAEEWESLQAGVIGGPALVSVAQGGVWDALKEAGAISKALAQATQSADSLLVRDLANTKGLHNPYKGVQSPFELADLVTADLKKATDILAAKDEADLAAYRTFVVSLAQDAANAAGGGTSEPEQQMIDKVKEALGA